MNRLEAVSSAFLQDPASIWFVVIFLGVIVLVFWLGHQATRKKDEETRKITSRTLKDNDFDEPWR